jgi:salicylate hydroxylase
MSLPGLDTHAGDERGGMRLQAIVSGGGIGGLAAALALARAGWDVRVLEKSLAFSGVGAGLQLGPNVVKVLHHWGLRDVLSAVAAAPARLQVMCALSGDRLAQLDLGPAIALRYGAPYLTLHRADLHALLLAALRQTDARLYLDRPVQDFIQTDTGVTVQPTARLALECDALIGADGLWSSVRTQLLGDGLPRRTGHLAYRALVSQAGLPQALRSSDVTVWLGPRMHVVHYPVRGGEWLNLVAFVHGQVDDADQRAQGWDQRASAAELRDGMKGACRALSQRIEAVEDWSLWVMYDRVPMKAARQMANGRVALLGDAAHPMRPYLAQGAGMAIEDAAFLGRALAQADPSGSDVAARLQGYAQQRWQRNAKVQSRALRNGMVFHADGVLRWGRDAALKMLGSRLLDMPWLYGGPPGQA